MAFLPGFSKSAAAAPQSLGSQAKGLGKGLLKHLGDGAKGVGQHMKKNRKDYLLGAAAAGSLGTAYGANKGKK